MTLPVRAAVDGTAAGDLAPHEVPASVRSLNVASAVGPVLMRELEVKGLSLGSPVFMRAFKEERELEVWVEREGGFQLFRTYPIAAVSGWLGPKRWEGDLQAPEGFYRVMPSQMNPNSRFHLSFDIGYPNDFDRMKYCTGSALMVHGKKTSRGCFAMTDEKIEEIYVLADAALRNGQPFFQFHSFPFRMTDQNMERNRDSKWFDFWKNLKTGYDLFEAYQRPPKVFVESGRYGFDCHGS
ncbi:MAG TPA: murein L,D-transpeptidase [Desulfobacteraceae bacterium]|nr:murein L,D-transpeptidase [Desulfobacteraceae bacterium]